MSQLSGLRVFGASAVLVLWMTSAGCATKKYVLASVDPVATRVGAVEKKSAEHTTSITDLERELAATGERATGADRKAMAAGTEAANAKDLAMQAGQRADGARTFAEGGLSRAGARADELERTIENLDNYKLVTAESLLFRVNSSALTDEGKAVLENAAKQVAGMKSYILEVQGFTDATGNAEHNLALSRKRADSVVRYLTSEHEIPLRRIHVLGVGSQAPAADNKTAAGRKQNRRVEVKVFALDAKGTKTQSKASAPATQ